MCANGDTNKMLYTRTCANGDTNKMLYTRTCALTGIQIKCYILGHVC